MLLTIIILSISITAVAVILIGIRYYNKQKAPTCFSFDNSTEDYCDVCGASNINNCAKTTEN